MLLTQLVLFLNFKCYTMEEYRVLFTFCLVDTNTLHYVCLFYLLFFAPHSLFGANLNILILCFSF